MKCLLDLDGVLVDFVRGACEVHGKPNPFPEYTGWDITTPFQMGDAEFWAPMGREFWAGLNWTEDGPAILSAVEARFGPENVCLLTSPATTDGCIDGKMDWIKRHMPAYRRRFLVGPAKEFCAGRGHVMVDDHDGNTSKFLKSGGEAVLVPRPWNENRGVDIAVAEYVALELDVLISHGSLD